MVPVSNRDREIKNSGLYLSAVIVSYAMPLLAIPFLTRLISPHDYGILALSSVFNAFLITLVNFGLGVIYQRDYFKYVKNRFQNAALLYSILIFIVCFFIILFIPIVFFNDPLSQFIFNKSDLGHVLLWDALACLFAGLNQYYLFYFQNSQEAKKNITWSLVSMAGGTFIGLALVVMGAGYMGLIWAKLVTDLFIFIYLTRYFLSHLSFSLDFKLLLTSIRYALPLTPNIFTKVLTRSGDKYFINMLQSTGQTGIYNIADKFAYISFALMTAFDQVYLPNILKKMFENKKGVSKEIGVYLTPFFYLSMLFCLLIAVFSHEIVWILTPVGYHGAADMMIVLVMYYALLFFGGKQAQLLFAGKTATMSIINFFNMVTVIGLNIIFIKKWGAMGAAWATFCSGFVFGGIYFYVSQKAFYIAWEYKKISIILFYFLISSFTVLMLSHLLSYPLIFMVKVFIFLTYIYIGWKFKIVNKENINLLKDVFLEKFI